MATAIDKIDAAMEVVLKSIKSTNYFEIIIYNLVKINILA